MGGDSQRKRPTPVFSGLPSSRVPARPAHDAHRVGERDRVLVEKLIRAIESEIPGEPDDADFPQGSVDALQWASGARPVSPITEEVYAEDELTTHRLRVEEDEANAALYHLRPRPEGRRQSYIVAVEHALMWVRGTEDSLPYPVSPGWDA